jgi:hypothetical protein
MRQKPWKIKGPLIANNILNKKIDPLQMSN